MILVDPDARPLIGHRGTAGTHPENTIPSFDAAFAAGVDAIELDVHAARDGVPVVIHDATLDRTTNATGAVSAMTSEQLRDVDAGAGAHVPTLSEVLERYPTTPMIVEIKDGSVTAAVLALLRRLGAIDRVLLGAFDHDALAAARTDEFHLSASRRETAVVWAAARFGIAVGGPFNGFTVPERQGAIHVVDTKFVRAATRRGKPVHVWTVDAVDDASRLRAMGVAGIITNFPGIMQNI